MSDSETASASVASSVDVGRATPILRVSDLDASLAYYADALGFEQEWRARGFASVRRGRGSIMLCEGDQGHLGAWIWIAVSDADALHAELRARGAIIRHPPTNYPWESRELHVADPDGNVLRLGSDLKPGEPMGEWLDGSGVRWAPTADGGWRSVE
ncbi:MAG: putative glyoxalase family protein [Gemmatimonadetes bacterium]|nr:putative glyoxalase family protein [Gemmatimonadota bacterium]